MRLTTLLARSRMPNKAVTSVNQFNGTVT